MARFLFTAWPFPGHLFPQVSIALALRSRGHDVAFYTGTRLQSVLETEGFTVFPFRAVDESLVWDIAVTVQSRERLDLRLISRVCNEWLLGTVSAQVADLRQIMGDWQPSALATDPMMWGPSLVLWEATRLPVAISAVVLGCPIDGSDAPPWGPGLPPPRTPLTRLATRAYRAGSYLVGAGLRRQIDQMRARNGLAPLGCAVNTFLGRLPLYLVPSVRSFDYGRRDLPASVHYVGPCVWNKPSREPRPPWLHQRSGDRPLVHVSEGTMHFQAPFLLRAAVQGLGNLPMEVIITTGRERDPATLDLGRRANNIRVEQWVSYADLMPHCGAVVTTGGAGTVLASLQAGVPLVIVPSHSDHPETARRVVEAGVGVRLARRACTPERLRSAVEHVLAEASFRANAQRLAGELARAPGPSGAATLMEGLVASVEATVA